MLPNLKLTLGKVSLSYLSSYYYYVLYLGTLGWCKVVRKHYAYLLNKLSAQTFGTKNFNETTPRTSAQKQLFKKRSCFYKLIKLVNSFMALIKAENLNCK